MNLSQKQIRYIKSNYKNKSSEKIAEYLDISVSVVDEFITKRYGISSKKGNKNIKTGKNIPSIVELFSYDLVSWLQDTWHYFIPILFIFLCIYANVFFATFVSDDLSIVKAFTIGPVDTYIFNSMLMILRPSVYLLIQTIFGLDPFFFRVSNMLFHIGTAFFLFTLIGLMTRSKFIAFVSSFLFVIHPIIIESVTWIAGGVYPQYSFFFMGSILFYYLSKKEIKFYYLSLIFFLCSLLSSDKALSYIFVIILFEFVFFDLRKNWKMLLPYFFITCVFSFFYLDLAVSRVVSLQKDYYMNAGMDNPFLQVPIAIAEYLRLLFYPILLSFYQSKIYYSNSDILLRWIVFIGYISAVIYAYLKDKFIFFWLVFFICILIPTLLPIRISYLYAERYLYLASFGIIVSVVYLLEKYYVQKSYKHYVIGVVALILILLSTRTYIRNFDWRNEDTLYIATAFTAPEDPKSFNNMGDVYSRHGEYEKAIEAFKHATEILPNYADAYHNMANNYQRINRKEEAMKYYLEAMKYNPNIPQTHENLSVLYFEKKDYQNAELHAKQAITLSQKSDQAFTVLGLMLVQNKNIDEAKKYFSVALQINPQNNIAQEMLKKLN
ncbi:MAG: tetratricopeptide repeat protein [Candidatus Roizmanbacteria bacterium]